MGFESLPRTAVDFLSWHWAQIEPYYADLASRAVTERTADGWLADWSRIAELLEESFWRLYVATTTDTSNAQAQALYSAFIDETQPAARVAEQKLKQKLIGSGIEPPGFEIALRNMRAEAALFREVNLPLLGEEKALGAGYQKIRSAQTVEWEGKALTLPQLSPYLLDPDRAIREKAWRLGTGRRLQDREAINQLWQSGLRLRDQLAKNAGLPNYVEYRWRQLLRFAYTPQDCETFHAAIEDVAVPAASRIFEKRRQRLGLDRLRPWDAGWDIAVDTSGQPPLEPFDHIDELVAKTGAIFRRLDPALGEHFDLMAREKLLDLDNRPGKMAGAYCTTYAAARRPFIFMNAVGLHVDLLTLVHEAGHAFHWCESYRQPYFQNRGLDFQPIEFVEVASTAMEYLTEPFYADPEIGFYSQQEAARAQIEHLETAVLFWPYMAVVDAFQLWAYTHIDEALDPAACDAQWAALIRRYVPDVDWSGLDDALESSWQPKIHLFESPLYYVEYGLAQLGAIQLWRNALKDPASALRDYQLALGHGSTLALPELYAAAGVRLSWDAPALREAVGLIRARLDSLESG